jgi:hypothetical protein
MNITRISVVHAVPECFTWPNMTQVKGLVSWFLWLLIKNRYSVGKDTIFTSMAYYCILDSESEHMITYIFKNMWNSGFN